MGWVDGDAIWRLDVASGRVDTIPLASGARYVSLHAGDGDRVAVAHHFDGRRFEVSVRAVADPSKTLARAVVSAAASGQPGQRGHHARGGDLANRVVLVIGHKIGRAYV